MKKRPTISFAVFSQEKQTEIIKKYKAFFAFSGKQFNEQREEGVKYYEVGAGLLVPQKNYKAFTKEFNTTINQLSQEYLSLYSKKDIIWYELANHEAGYTGSWGSTFEAVEHLKITKDEVRKEFYSYLNYQAQHCNN